MYVFTILSLLVLEAHKQVPVPTLPSEPEIILKLSLPSKTFDCFIAEANKKTDKD